MQLQDSNKTHTKALEDHLCHHRNWARPLSPELLKMFIHDLSRRLTDIDYLSVPLLYEFPISHLLWADGLILLALDAKTLQTQLDCLHEFVSEWELSINIHKTNIMVFNNCSYGFKLVDIKVEPSRNYCYLGILSRWYPTFAAHELKNSIRRI